MARRRLIASLPATIRAATSVMFDGECHDVGWHAPGTTIRLLAADRRAHHIEMLAATAGDGIAGFATFAEQGSRVGRTFHRDPIPSGRDIDDTPQDCPPLQATSSSATCFIKSTLNATSNEHTLTAYSINRGIRSEVVRNPNPAISPYPQT